MLLISIPKPCHEDWDDMSPREQGAFCKVCSKTVVDFTKWSSEEIANYFQQRQDQKTCGRFRDDQLAGPRTLPELLSRPIPFWKKFLAIVLILFDTFLTGCNNSNQSKLRAELLVTTGVTLIDTKEDAVPGEGKCTMVGTPVSILGELTEPVIIDVDGVKPMPALDTPEIELGIDTVFFTGGIIVDTIKQISQSSTKIDSVKKMANPNNCDTLPLRAIEP